MTSSIIRILPVESGNFNEKISQLVNNSRPNTMHQQLVLFERRYYEEEE